MIPRLILLVLISVIALKTVSSEVYRLPDNIKPIRYFLTLEPQLNFSEVYDDIPYYGSVTIELEIVKNTKSITFHKTQLEIDESSIKVLNKQGKKLKVTGTTTKEIEDMYIIQMEDELIQSETYTLEINNFYNNLTYDGLGFFKAHYKSRNDETGEDETR